MPLAACFARADESLAANIPVSCLTPADYSEAIRFYDTSPVDASLRYLAVTRFPDDTRLPRPGDPAQVVIRDLHTGKDIAIEETTAWDTQLGAQPQWHPQQPRLYFNVMGTDNLPHACCLDLLTGARTEAAGPVYMLSPDGTRLASPDLRKTGHAQPGYGVHVDDPPRNTGAPEHDGVWITDLATNQMRLAASLRHLAENAGLGDPCSGEWYVFHVKWNPVYDRLLIVVRWKQECGGWRRAVVTCGSEGADTRCLITATQWAPGGHHPNWTPDGCGIIMNLRLTPDGPLRFVRVPDKDGARHSVLTERPGSGHPTLNPAMTHLLTDAYRRESMARNGAVPLRWIHLESGTETTLCLVGAAPVFPGPKLEWRVDPHPAWCMDGRHIVFNGWHRGRRRVFLGDLREYVE